MKTLSISIFLILQVLLLQAQQTVFEEGETIYAKENAGGLTLHTNGWGLFYWNSKYLTGFTKRQFHFELVGMKSLRQFRIPIGGQGYDFGKLNSLYILRTSIGFQKVFLPRQSLRGVSVSWIANAGLSSGFAFPVYLTVKLENGNIVDERYDPVKHSRSNVQRRAYPWVGVGEVQYHPGLYLRAALNFDYAARSKMVRAIEVGLASDIFARPVVIMAFENPNRYFVTAFVNFAFGARKYAGENKETVPAGE